MRPEPSLRGDFLEGTVELLDLDGRNHETAGAPFPPVFFRASAFQRVGQKGRKRMTAPSRFTGGLREVPAIIGLSSTIHAALFANPAGSTRIEILSLAQTRRDAKLLNP